MSFSVCTYICIYHLGENLLYSLQSLISMHVFLVGLAVGSFGVQVNLQCTLTFVHTVRTFQDFFLT